MIENTLIFVIVASSVVWLSWKLKKSFMGKTSGCNCTAADCELKDICKKS